MSIKLACADFTFPLVPLETSFDIITKLQIPGVDLAFNRASRIPLEHVLREPEKTARYINKLLDSRGLEIADVSLTFGTGFADYAMNDPSLNVRNELREAFTRGLEFALRCNATGITLLPGIHWPYETHQSSLHRTSEELLWRLDQSTKLGIDISIEPHVESVCQTPEWTLQLLEQTKGLRLTLDYAHFICQGISQDDVDPLMPYARILHMRGASTNKLQASMKENTIDFHKLVHVAQQNQFDGYMELEYVWIEWRKCNQVDTLSETIQLRDILADSLRTSDT